MIPANDDPTTLAEQRKRIYAELEARGQTPMTQADLDVWKDELASILAAWAMQDGVTYDEIRAASIPESSMIAFRLYQLMAVVMRAHNQEIQQLIAEGVEEDLRLRFYEGGAEAAQRAMQGRFEAAVASHGLPDLEAKYLVAMMLMHVSKTVINRLKALLDQQ